MTRDYGAAPVLERSSVEANESDTVMRVLEGERRDLDPLRRRLRAVDRRASKKTERGGRPYDWFFYVNGVESPIGAADYAAARRRADLVGLPRLVGDATACRPWSAPGRRRSPTATKASAHPVAVECQGGGGACARGARGAAKATGVALAAGSPDGAIRVLVGPWARLRSDPAAALIEDGPRGKRRLRRLRAAGAGGGCVGWSALDEAGEPAPRPRPRRRPGRRDPPLRSAAGLGRHRRRRQPAVQRRRRRCSTPTSLRDHYAVASEDGKETPLPRARVAMRSPFAYTPRPGPLQAASPGAAVAYLGALVAVAFLYSSPLVLLAGRGRR